MLAGSAVSAAALEVFDEVLEGLRPQRRRLRYEVLRADRIATSTADAWRGALGREVVRWRPDLVELAWADEDRQRPPALWFRGWDALALDPAAEVAVDLVHVEAAASRGLEPLLERLRVRDALLRLIEVVPVPAQPRLPGAPVVVTATTPLALTENGARVKDVPSLRTLVRSAGHRLANLDARWGLGHPTLRQHVGAVVRACEEPGVALDRESHAVRRRRGSAGPHTYGGILGRWRYDAVPPDAVALLHVGALLGIGKGVAFGCGDYAVERQADPGAP